MVRIVDASTHISPRILILEADSQSRSMLRDLVVKGLRDVSVQANNLTLADAVSDADRIKSFDVLVVGCDFGPDGTAKDPIFQALRSLSIDPESPAIVLLPEGGSEYTAVQAIKAGAYEYVPKKLMGRDQVISSIQRALHERQPMPKRNASDGDEISRRHAKLRREQLDLALRRMDFRIQGIAEEKRSEEKNSRDCVADSSREVCRVIARLGEQITEFEALRSELSAGLEVLILEAAGDGL